MGQSIWAAIRDLQDLQERIIAGEFPTRSPLGPGQIQTKNIRARAVTAPLISVSNLEAVNTQTGSLTVDGTIDVSTDGKIVSGTDTDDWATFTGSPGGGLGYYLEYDETYGALMAVGDFNNVSGQYLKWDGSALTIKGVITASAGSIAGWLITADAIETSDGEVGMASSGHSAVSFWAGHATPSSAPFIVTSAGDLYATNAFITGDITAETGTLSDLNVDGTLEMGTGSIIRTTGTTGFNSGTGIYFHYNAGTPRFSLGNTVGTNGFAWDGSALTVKGEIRATSGQFTGDVTISGSNAGFSAGQSAYDTGTGFWLGNVVGSPRFSIGNSAGNKLTWNGSTLAITGTLTSTAGSIGGWTIDSSGLRLGSGSTTRGMDTGSTAFYAGNATPGSAPFRVTTGGALTATNATITGAITATSGSFTGTIDANAGTLSGLTVDGTVTVGSGGKIAFGTSAADYLDNDILHFNTSTTQQGKIRMQRSGTNRHAIFYSYDDGSDVYGTIGVTESAPTSNYNSIVFNAGIDFASDGVTTIQAVNAGLTTVDTISLDATIDRIRLAASSLRMSGTLMFDSTDFTAAGSYYGRIPVTYNGLTKYLHVFNP